MLLVNLVYYVLNYLRLGESNIFPWTDSSIILGWLAKPSRSWETYVANRLSEIHQLVPNTICRHVPSHENRADVSTKGCMPQDLQNNALWWKEQIWLSKPPSEWPTKNPLLPTAFGKKHHKMVVTTEITDILQRFSSFQGALRALSYVFRFAHSTCLRLKTDVHTSVSLLEREVRAFKVCFLILAHKRYHKVEYQTLSENNPISSNSSLKP